jgi:transcriptional regulator with PAS, ATPase and Fis domain
MFVAAKSENDKAYFVLKNVLGHLIEEKKIQKFLRSEGWIDIEKDQRKEERNKYNGFERRVSGAVNWAFLPLSIVEQLRKGHSVEGILGYGQKAREIAVRLKSVANTKLSVLLRGKTGTGKGIAASILHELSDRKNKPFIKVDCGAIPPTLIESELFGHEKGSFTGAFQSKPGRFQMANRGTILLDEISNLSMDMQTRLLGFLEERMVNTVGGVSPINLDVRVISASNVDLEEQILSHQFREDLFYRLSEFQINLPPLKERSDDLLYLAGKFIWMANTELSKNVFGLSESAIDFLSRFEWNGNIRQLKNLMKRAVLLADEVIEIWHLNGYEKEGQNGASLDSLLENAFLKGRSLPEIKEVISKSAEKTIIERVYLQRNKNKMQTSSALGIDYSTLYRKMKEYGIE